jgi:hypothetical protein
MKGGLICREREGVRWCVAGHERWMVWSGM